MSDEIITNDYGFGVVQINKTNNDKPEEIGISNYLLADNNILSKKVKSLEHENKVLKRALELAVVDMTHTNDEYTRHIKEQHYLLNAKEEIEDDNT